MENCFLTEKLIRKAYGKLFP